MPAALERALKRRASKLGLGKERKDAYVYGTLRKTGWKPSHQMNTPNERMIRLAVIDKKLNSIVQFQDNPDDQDDNQKKFPWLKTAAVAGTGAGAVLGHQAVQRAGGYGANLAAAKSAYRYGPDLLAKATGSAGKIGSKLGGLAGKFAKPLLGRFGLESKEKVIELDEEARHVSEKILEPWMSVPKTKLYQGQFPAGLSPLAAMKLPFPELMKYLNKRQILQQVFSSKHRRLIELNAKLDEIQFKMTDEEFKSRFGMTPDELNRTTNTGPYRKPWRTDRSGKTIKGGIVATAGLAGGYAAAKGIQATHPIARGKAAGTAMSKALTRIAHEEPPWRKVPGRILKAGYKGARYAKLSAQVDDLIEFQLPEKLKQKIKEKIDKKKKGRVSHGGGT